MTRLEIKGLKNHYYASESIEGQILLFDTNGLEIRGLYLKLYYQIIAFTGSDGRATHSHRYVDRVGIYAEKLEGHKRFESDNASYDFKIDIPDNVPPSINYEDRRKIEWILNVKLDIPHHRDINKNILLTIYNSVEPPQHVTGETYVDEAYARLEVDKNIFEYNEPIMGRFIIHKIPSNLRRVRICLHGYLEMKFEEKLFSKDITSDYEITCRDYDADELESGREYRFILKKEDIWPITYLDPRVKSTAYVLLRLDRKLATDILLKIPVTIYYAKKKSMLIEEETVSIEKTKTINKLSEIIMEIMKDGKARDVVDIRFKLDFMYDVNEIMKACEKLVDEGLLEVVEEGELLRKYRIKHNA